MRGTFEWLFSYTHTQNCCRTEYEQNSLASVTQTTRITSICCINLNLILNTECEYLTWNGKYFFCLYAHTHFYFGLEIGVISSRQLRQCGGGEADESAWQTKHNSKCLTSVSSNRLLCNRTFSHEFICQFCEFSSRFSCCIQSIRIRMLQKCSAIIRTPQTVVAFSILLFSLSLCAFTCFIIHEEN